MYGTQMTVVVRKNCGEAFGRRSTILDLGVEINDLFDKPKKVVVITNPDVYDRYWNKVQDSLRAVGIIPLPLKTPGTEHNKTLTEASRLAHEIWSMQVSRSTPLIAMGGGVVTDIGAFVASMVQRGMPLALVPTTLLCAADASIGGKTGVNAESIAGTSTKNYFGSFYFAKGAVFCHEFLETNSPALMREGLAEIIKHCFLNDTLDQLDVEKVLARDANEIDVAVDNSAYFKERICQRDPWDHGERQCLNFGHTVGHAIETASCFEKSHGEAIALGMIVEAQLAIMRNALADPCAASLALKLLQAGLRWKPTYDVEHLISIMRHDKKNRDDKIKFSSPHDHGALYEATDAEIREAYRAVQ
jgi:3-dehydroquinate synthase